MPLTRLLSLIAPPLCIGCGAAARVQDPLCQACRGQLRWLGDQQAAGAGVPAWAAVGYEGPARAMVRALKFRGALRLVDAMAAQMAANAPPQLVAERSLVPVPLHPTRRRRRGFNQAEELARALARRLDLQVIDCLVRSGGGALATQVGLGRDERLAGLEGRVHMREGAPVPLRALLVDDVVTTGATLAECARALTVAGVTDVAAIAYARTPGR